MGCAIHNQKNKSFNHNQQLQQISNTFKSNKIISLQTFETYFMCAQSSLQQYTLTQYSRQANTHNLLARFRLFLLCNRFTVYQQGFYGAIQSINHQAFKSISKDVHRTYPNQPFFKISSNIKKFQRVLKHIALFFPQHGYTQGINFVVGFLLLQGASQQQAFWMFVNLALNHNFFILGLYQQGFPLSELYYFIFEELLKKYSPMLYAKLIQKYISKESWIFQWFLTFFSYSFPIEVSMIIWQYILINGSFSMIYISLGLIKQIQQQLLKLEDEVVFCQFFQKLRQKQTLLNTLKDINFKNVFNFAQNLKVSQNINIIQIVKNCPYQSKYKHFISKSVQQKVEEIKLFQVELLNKRNIHFKNPTNQIIQQKSIKNQQKRSNNFSIFLQIPDNLCLNKKSKQDSTIVDTKNALSDQISKQNSFDF